MSHGPLRLGYQRHQHFLRSRWRLHRSTEHHIPAARRHLSVLFLLSDRLLGYLSIVSIQFDSSIAFLHIQRFVSNWLLKIPLLDACTSLDYPSFLDVLEVWTIYKISFFNFHEITIWVNWFLFTLMLRSKIMAVSHVSFLPAPSSLTRS